MPQRGSTILDCADYNREMVSVVSGYSVGAIAADATGRARSAAGECAIDGGRLSKIRFLPNEPKSACLDPPG